MGLRDKLQVAYWLTDDNEFREGLRQMVEKLSACDKALIMAKRAMTNNRYRKPRIGMEEAYAAVQEAIDMMEIGQ